MKTEYNTLLYEEKDGIGYVKINMPPANKMIPDFLVEIGEVFESGILERDTVGIIITGVGRHFSSGADVDKLLSFVTASKGTDGSIVPDWYTRTKEILWNLQYQDKPVISAVRGCAIGSGLELALSSHICVAEKGSMIGFPEATFGLLPGMSGTLYSVRALGRQRAFFTILNGELQFIEKKEDSPFVDMVVEKRKALETAEELVKLWANLGGPKKVQKVDLLARYQSH